MKALIHSLIAVAIFVTFLSIESAAYCAYCAGDFCYSQSSCLPGCICYRSDSTVEGRCIPAR